MNTLKTSLRQSFIAPLYFWGANRYRMLRRLFIYPDTAKVGDVNYDDYWDKKAASGLGILSEWRRKRADVFSQLVREGEHVLDLGVGDGALLKYMIEHAKIVGYGLDISPKAVAFCREQGLNVDLADVNRPLGEFIQQPYDVIVLSEIIEHLPDPEHLLNELRPHVKRSLLVSVPNTGFHQHRLRLLFGRFPLQWVVTPGEHLRYWTLADFKWWARQLDFEVVRAVPYEGTPLLKAWFPSWFAAAFVYELRDKKIRKQA